MIGLTIGLHALGSVLHSILRGGVPAVHVVLALIIARAILERAFLPRAKPTEWPVNGYAAVASRLAILMRVAVLVLDQAEALPLLAFLSDTLDVLTTISARVQQRAIGAHGDAVLLDFSEFYLRIILDYKDYHELWCLHPWFSRGVCVCRDSLSQA